MSYFWIVVGGLVVLYLLTTAFGSLKPGKFRRVLHRVVYGLVSGLLVWVAVVILAIVLNNLVFKSDSPISLAGNIFFAIMGALMALTLAADFIPESVTRWFGREKDDHQP